MTPSRWVRIQDAFLAVIDRRKESRAHAARDIAGSDVTLVDHLNRLLINYRSHDTALDWAEKQDAANAWKPTLEPGELLAMRFRIKNFLGRGGMGEVYECWDELLEVPVAAKIIGGHFRRNFEFRQQFLREVQLAQLVTHPNVCRVHDIYQHVVVSPKDGSEQFIHFLTMQLLRGETLAEFLKKSGPLPYETALRFLRQMAEGLTAAHVQGIVHCDFKPGNVFLVPEGESSRVVITDFGLAVVCAVAVQKEAEGPNGHQAVPRLGCTPPYAAPEVLNGLEPVPASDVYSLGLVASEILTGAPTASSELLPSKRAREGIERCLEADANKRFGSPIDFVRYLEDDFSQLAEKRQVTRRAVLVAASAACAAGAITVWVRKNNAGAPANNIALLVLPFSTTSQDQLEFVEGFATELMRTLRTSTRIRIVSPYEALQLNQPFDFKTIAGKFAADYLVTGVFAAETVEVKLMRADARIVWSGLFPRRNVSDFVLQKRIELALLAELDQHTAAILSKPSYEPPPEVYGAYLQASYLLNRRANEDLAAAEKILQNVIKQAPEFAAGWAVYAHALHLQGHLREAGDAARQAIKLAPDDCEAHLALALVLQRLEWNWADAETHFRRALDVQPLSCRAHHWYGGLLSDLGRGTPALRELKLAVELDPLDVPAATAYGICTFFSRAFEPAIPKLERAIDLAHRLRLDRFPWEAYCYLGASYLFTNNERLAVANFRKAIHGSPDNAIVQAHYVHGLARLGYLHKARDEMQRLLSLGDVLSCPFYAGVAWAALNDKTRAFASLQTAVAQRDGELTLLKVHPYLDNLRTESAYSDLLRQMKFPA